MGKNNPLRDMTPQRRNYKLYKAKKQWFTACATFLVALGAMAATSTVHAAPQPTAGNTNNSSNFRCCLFSH